MNNEDKTVTEQARALPPERRFAPWRPGFPGACVRLSVGRSGTFRQNCARQGEL